jgi:hypothetical protein
MEIINKLSTDRLPSAPLEDAQELLRQMQEQHRVLFLGFFQDPEPRNPVLRQYLPQAEPGVGPDSFDFVVPVNDILLISLVSFFREDPSPARLSLVWQRLDKLGGRILVRSPGVEPCP